MADLQPGAQRDGGGLNKHRRDNLPENLLFPNWKVEEHVGAQRQIKLPKAGPKEETARWLQLPHRALGGP